MRKILSEFRQFAIKGNAVEMAIGIMIGAAFATVVKSLVGDVMMPPLGLLLGGVDFKDLFVVLKSGELAGPYATLELAQQAGAVTLNYGLFINSIISFLITSMALFFIVRGMNGMRRKEEEPPALSFQCPECRQAVNPDATRCPHCTSKMNPVQV